MMARIMIKKKKGSRSKRVVSKPIGLLQRGKTFRFAFGTKKNPRAGRKVFRSRKAAEEAVVKRLKR